MKRIHMKISPSISPKMLMLIGDLEKAGFIKDGYLMYEDEQEYAVKAILEKYEVKI